MVVIAVAAWWFLLKPSATPTGSAAQPTVAASAPSGGPVQFGVVQQMPDEGRTHVAEGSAINYKNNPPSSGPHYPSPQNWGIYDKAVPAGYFVHNLEHGGVVVLYDCPNGCAATVDVLKKAFDTFPKDKFNEVKLVGTSYHGLPGGAHVALLAWDFQELLPGDLSMDQLQQFYQAHADKPCPDNGPFIACSPENIP